MTLSRARVIKAAGVAAPAPPAAPAALARRIPAAVVAAREEAARIVAAAVAKATAVATEASARAHEEAVARLAAGFVALRAEDERRAERDLDRTVELAVLLAERLLGEALHVAPERIAELAARTLAETRGARQIRIDAAPEDAAPLAAMLEASGHPARVTADPALRRGSLVVHTDLGRIDARLEPQLGRLAVALREALA